MIEVVRPGPLATVQDLGRPGQAHLGVPHSGAADSVSLRLANRLVGNDEGAAGIELTFGGAALRFTAPAWIAVTGAPAPGVDMYAPFHVAGGEQVAFGPPLDGVRTYVAVRGGIDVPPVLGSRSADTLSGLGPAPLRAGDVLPVGPAGGLAEINIDDAPAPDYRTPAVLRALAGPREDWFAAGALATLRESAYEVTPAGNRVGIRLRGAPLRRSRQGELGSEGVVTGALQVPPDGLPIIFLVDHPTTGGYPVIAVLLAADIGRAAQLRPGQRVRFAVSSS